MDDADRTRYEASAQQLRADLKRFEADWAIDHDGSKPQRDDIKRNPDIGNLPPALRTTLQPLPTTTY